MSDISFLWVHSDHLGTPRILTDADQNKVWEVQTTPFGEISEEVSDGITQLKGFPGQMRDPETGYSDNWHRVYDSSIGRYISSDLIGLNGGLNTYAYVGGNPIMYFDPNGLAQIVSGFDGSNLSFTEYAKKKSEYLNTPAGQREVILIQLNNMMERELRKKCSKESNIYIRFTSWKIIVNPDIDTMNHILHSVGPATTVYGTQTTTINHDFFTQNGGDYFAFVHEFRHLMPENDRLYGSASNAANFFNTDTYPPHEKDADNWASSFLSGNCECE